MVRTDTVSEQLCSLPGPVLALDVVCFGLGSPHTSETAQHQLACLILLLDKWRLASKRVALPESDSDAALRSAAAASVGQLSDAMSAMAIAPDASPAISLAQVSAYDPVFDPVDVALLAHFGISVSLQNAEGQWRAERHTLFFMPHCGDAMYHQVCRANWDADRLARILIVGNSFSNYQSKVNFRAESASGGASDAEFCFLALARATVETPVDDALYEHVAVGAFNDTAVHRFDTDRMRAMGDAFWQRVPPPYAAGAAHSGAASEIIPASATDQRAASVRKTDGTIKET